MPKATVNYALAATLMASGVPLGEAALECGAKNADSLRVGLARRGVTITGIRHAEGNIARLTTVARKVVSEQSRALKEDMASILAEHVSKLKEVKPRANLKHIRQLGEAIEPLVRSAKIVHNWGDETVAGLDMSGIYEAQGAIDIQATPQQLVSGPETVENNSCDTPSDSTQDNGS
jgi:hypothetical protein